MKYIDPIDFVYTDYCTAFYIPETGAVMVYDEINEDMIQIIPVTTEAEAETVLFRWRMHSPCDCICHVL